MSNELIGKKIVGVRRMTRAEVDSEGWQGLEGGATCIALVLDDGTVLYPSRDSEGNGPGELFGYQGEHRYFYIPADPIRKGASK